MNRLALPLIDGALHIDNSTLEKFTTCPRSGEYYLYRKRESSADRWPLLFGGIIHKALEFRYNNLRLPTEILLPEIVAILGKEFETASPPEGDHRNYQFAVEIMVKYLEQYPTEPFEILTVGDGTSLVEVSFAIPLGHIPLAESILVSNNGADPIVMNAGLHLPVVWTGRIDLAYRHEGKPYLMDHKTTSMLGATYWTSFDLSHATHGYAWAMKKLTGERPFGYVINALATRRATKTGKGIELERKSIFLSEAHLNEWELDTLHIVATFVRQQAWDYFPKHTAWCVGKFGVCPYKDVCDMPPASREVILMSDNYKDVTWTPHGE